MPEAGGGNKWWVLIGISLLGFCGFIDFTIVNTILPAIQRDLHATVGELQWMMNGFLLALTTLMLAMGRLGDIFGCRLVLYAGVIVFAIASLLAGLSDDPAWLVVWRIVQGVGCAITFTCPIALLTHAWPENEQGRVIGYYAGLTGIGLALGPVLGGLLVSVASWRWAFFINIPVIALGFLISLRHVRETPKLPGEKIDWRGLVLLVAGAGSLITAIMQGDVWGWGSPLTLGLSTVAAVCIALLVPTERKAKSPLIDFKLFNNKTFLAACVAGFTLGAFIGLNFFLAPLYLQNVRNEAPLIAGLMLVPISGLVVLVPPAIGRVADALGPKPVILAGLMCLAATSAVQLAFSAGSPAWWVILGMALLGMGWGLQQGTTPNAAAASLPKGAAGVAIGALFTFWNLGSNVGIAVGGTIFELLDKATLMAGLTHEQIALSPDQRHLVRSLLSDPSEARQTLREFSPGLEERILPLFHDAFMTGYTGAMWYLLATGIIGAMLVYFLMEPRFMRVRPGALPAGD